MTKVIGVRFRTAGKIYFFSPGKYEIKKGDHVIVETARGVEYGTVVAAPKEIEDSEVVKPLKTVLRTASTKDDEQEKANREKEREAFKICLEKIKKHNLDMKLIDAEYTFDNNKILFYFTADGRIDFRELVKDLAAIFKTRIELRQIGVRDEIRRIGGNGICGRELCCCSFLGNFDTVSIKMAKEQNIALNPSKISGSCGRLMCCLKYEQEVYEEKLKRLPKIGSIVKVPEGKGTVENVETLKEVVKVKLQDAEDIYYKKYNIKDVKIIKNVENEKIDEEEENNIKELEELEKLDKLEQEENLNNGEI